MKDKIAIISIAVLFGILSYFLGSTVSLFIIFGLAAYFIYMSSPPEDRGFILTVLIAGFAIRVVLAVLLHASSYVNGYEGSTSGDDLLYTVRSWAVVYKWEGKPYVWIRSLVGLSEYGLNPLTYVLAFFYKIFGFHPAASKFISCIIGSLIGWMSYLIGREMFDRTTGKIAMLIVMFYPSLIRWSVANLKDPMTTILFMVGVYVLIAGLYRKIALWQLLVLLASMVVISFFSYGFYIILILGGGAILLFFKCLDLIKSKRVRSFTMLGAAFACILASIWIFYIKPSHMVNVLYQCEYKQKVMSEADSAGYYFYSGKLMQQLDRGVICVSELCKVVCVDTVYFLLTPFPWQMTSKVRLAALPQIILWYGILILSFFGFAKLVLRRPRIAFLMGVVLAIGVMFNALAEGNIGSAFRHRDIFTPFFVMLAARTIASLAKDTDVVMKPPGRAAR